MKQFRCTNCNNILDEPTDIEADPVGCGCGTFTLKAGLTPGSLHASGKLREVEYRIDDGPWQIYLDA